MIRWAIVGPDGRIGVAGETQALPSGAVPLPPHITLDRTPRFALVSGAWTEVEPLVEMIDPDVEMSARLRQVKRQALIDLGAHMEARIDIIVWPVSRTERDSWPSKEIAARRYVDLGSIEALSQADQSILLTEAMLVGETVEHLVTTILARADEYRPVGSLIAATRRNVTDALRAASSTQEVQAILAGAVAEFDAATQAAVDAAAVDL